MRLLFLGDIVARPGRHAVRNRLPGIRDALGLDIVIANAENAAGGLGLTIKAARELLDSGIDVLTSGNHIWRHKELYDYIGSEPRLLRPANYPAGAPGRGVGLYDLPGGGTFAVFNLMGRTWMEPMDCPFRAAEQLLARLSEDVLIRIVDFHAEATSEKIALAYWLDGKVSAVFGTHTHVQTNDARILPGGTAAITDAGMCGVTNSILGMEAAGIVRRFLTKLPTRLVPAMGDACLQGVVLDVDPTAGRATAVRVYNEAAP